MKTLVIHPKDKSTDFLKPIYHGRNWTVITGGTKQEVRDAIDEHDHIIMLGHGTPQGLLAVGQFKKKPYKKPEIKKLGKAPLLAQGGDRIPGEDDDLDFDYFDDRKVDSGYNYTSTFTSYTTGYVVDDTNADQLRKKKVTAIWCNADQYMEWNDLSGFYTGMFISERAEAVMIGTESAEEWMVEESNYEFARLMREMILMPNNDTLSQMKLKYGVLAKRNSVAKYNWLRLYSRYADRAAQVAS